MEELVIKIKSQMDIRGMESIADYNIELEIDSAAFVINDLRNFTSSDSLIVESQYKSLLIEMVIHAISKFGAEGEKTHSENGINRIYGTDGKYPLDLISRITPKVKGL